MERDLRARFPADSAKRRPEVAVHLPVYAVTQNEIAATVRNRDGSLVYQTTIARVSVGR